ncbi:MAG TPA: hypothetical protein VH374_13650 [Polyangia bacterium]|nr:hypothetical protein [Polyangia bacterium]
MTGIWGALILNLILALSHNLRARLLAAALLVPLLALATATSGMGLRCRLTGQVLSACCCDSGDDVAPTSPPIATVAQADCCDRVVQDASTVPAELSAMPTAPSDQSALVVAFDVTALDRLPSVLASRSETSVSTGPPTVRLRLVAKSSFLI